MPENATNKVLKAETGRRRVLLLLLEEQSHRGDAPGLMRAFSETLKKVIFCFGGTPAFLNISICCSDFCWAGDKEEKGRSLFKKRTHGAAVRVLQGRRLAQSHPAPTPTPSRSELPLSPSVLGEEEEKKKKTQAAKALKLLPNSGSDRRVTAV